MFIVTDASIDNRMAVVMLRVGGAESLALSLLPPLPPMPPLPPPTPPWPPPRDTTDGGLSLMTGDRTMSDTDDATSDGTTTLSYVFPSPPPDPPWLPMPEPRTTYIVGPLMYVYFSTVNASDAGFTVDLLFHHPDYLKVSLRFVTLSS